MKKQNSPIVIRYAVLMLMLGWTLVSGYTFAQNPSQKAYTTGTNANRVSQIDTATNMELQVPFPVPVFSPHGVDITYNNSDLVVSSSTACAPSNPCVTRIPIATGNPIPIPTGNGSQFVTVTPPIPNRGNCSFAYVTTGSANISEINLCDNSVRQPNIMLPGPGSPYSLGIAAAPLPDGTADVWVTDNNTNGKVFVFNTSITCPPPDQNGGSIERCGVRPGKAGPKGKEHAMPL